MGNVNFEIVSSAAVKLNDSAGSLQERLNFKNLDKSIADVVKCRVMTFRNTCTDHFLYFVYRLLCSYYWTPLNLPTSDGQTQCVLININSLSKRLCIPLEKINESIKKGMLLELIQNKISTIVSLQERILLIKNTSSVFDAIKKAIHEKILKECNKKINFCDELELSEDNFINDEIDKKKVAIKKIINDRLLNNQNNNVDADELAELLKIMPSLNQESSAPEKCSREIKVLSDDKNNQIFLKTPSFGKHRKFQLTTHAHDELSYRISYIFNFHVVPLTICNKHVVIQKGVCIDKDKKSELDLTHLQKVLIYHIFTGNMDARKSNSVLRNDGKYFGVDNEHIGNKTTDSWLFSAIKESTPINKELIEQIDRIGEEKLRNTIDDYYRETGLKVYNKDLADNMVKNLKKLKKIFSENQEKTTVGVLKKAFYEKF